MPCLIDYFNKLIWRELVVALLGTKLMVASMERERKRENELRSNFSMKKGIAY